MEHSSPSRINVTNILIDLVLDKVEVQAERVNSFVLLTFEKIVILEVSMTGAVNMPLRRAVKHKIV